MCASGEVQAGVLDLGATGGRGRRGVGEGGASGVWEGRERRPAVMRKVVSELGGGAEAGGSEGSKE